MGAISTRVSQMRGQSLAAIVSEIERMEAVKDFGPLGVGVANDFERFWSAYPRKVAKKTAIAAFRKAVQSTDFDVIMEGLRAYLGKDDDRPWCHAATWLSQERWSDDLASSAPSKPLRGLAAAKDQLRQEIAHGDGYRASGGGNLPAVRQLSYRS